MYCKIIFIIFVRMKNRVIFSLGGGCLVFYYSLAWSVISFSMQLFFIYSIGTGNFPQASIVQLQQILVCMTALFSCLIGWSFPVLCQHVREGGMTSLFTRIEFSMECRVSTETQGVFDLTCCSKIKLHSRHKDVWTLGWLYMWTLTTVLLAKWLNAWYRHNNNTK